MKCFSVYLALRDSVPEICDGIDMEWNLAGTRRVLLLGDTNRCRPRAAFYTPVHMCHRFPPPIEKEEEENGDVSEPNFFVSSAHPVVLPDGGVVLRGALVPTDDRALVRLRLKGGDGCGMDGLYTRLFGRVDELARGRGWNEQSGRFWLDTLVVMFVGASARVQFEGISGSYTLSYRSFSEGPVLEEGVGSVFRRYGSNVRKLSGGVPHSSRYKGSAMAA